jgi:hypothetical protein
MNFEIRTNDEFIYYKNYYNINIIDLFEIINKNNNINRISFINPITKKKMRLYKEDNKWIQTPYTISDILENISENIFTNEQKNILLEKLNNINIKLDEYHVYTESELILKFYKYDSI